MEPSIDDWRVRLRFRVTTRINSEEPQLRFNFGGHICTLSGQDEESLKNSYWLIINSVGHASERVAREFGDRLMNALLRVAVEIRWGIDVGEGNATSGTGQIVKDAVRERTGHELRDNVHGLDVFPNIPTFFSHLQFNATVHRPMEGLAEKLENASLPRNYKISKKLNTSNNLFASSMVMGEQISRLVLAVSAVELLSQGEKWTTAQRAVIDRLAMLGACDDSLNSSEAEGVRLGVARVYQQGVLIGMRALFERLGLDADLLERWLVIYSKRSGILHGHELVSSAEISQLAHDASEIVQRVLLAQLHLEIHGLNT